MGCFIQKLNFNMRINRLLFFLFVCNFYCSRLQLSTIVFLLPFTFSPTLVWLKLDFMEFLFGEQCYKEKFWKNISKPPLAEKPSFFATAQIFYTKDKLKWALFVSLQVLFTLTEIELNSLRSVEQNVRQSETASRKS